jgi:hypothetical protein
MLKCLGRHQADRAPSCMITRRPLSLRGKPQNGHNAKTETDTIHRAEPSHLHQPCVSHTEQGIEVLLPWWRRDANCVTRCWGRRECKLPPVQLRPVPLESGTHRNPGGLIAVLSRVLWWDVHATAQLDLENRSSLKRPADGSPMDRCDEARWKLTTRLV